MSLKNKITISELSRLINVSRPTLYRLIEDYENQHFDKVDEDYLNLFNYIYSDTVTSKDQIINYCMNEFKVDSDKSLLDKTKMLVKNNEQFRITLTTLINNIDHVDLQKLNEQLK